MATRDGLLISVRPRSVLRRASWLIGGLVLATTLAAPALAWADTTAPPDPTPTVSVAPSTSATATVTTPPATSTTVTPTSTTTAPVEPTTATLSPTRTAVARPTIGSRLRAAAQTTTSGVLRDAATGAPLVGACVAWASVGAPPPPQNNWTGVNGDGTWSIQTDQPGPFNLAFYTADNGDCSSPIHARPVPSWYQNQPLTGTDPATITPPAGVGAVLAGTSDVVACLGATALPTGPCAVPTSVLSGKVVTTGPTPVAQACIFILSPAGAIAQAITDAAGAWRIAGLPVNYPVVVGVIPPFQGDNGPCASNGPPPAPGPGQLQPEMYANTWVDLTDTTLFNDPYAWGVRHGATAVTNTASGLDVCLTTDPGTVVPRPACTLPTPPTVTTTVITTVATTPTPSATTAPVLAATGTTVLPFAGAGLGLIAAGCLILWTLGRRPRTH